MTSKSFIAGMIACFVFASTACLNAQDQQPVPTQPAPTQQDDGMTLVQKASRVMAYSFFSNMMSQGAELDAEQLIAGIRLAMEEKELGMTPEEIDSVLTAYNEEMVKRLMERRKAIGEENQAAAEKFFAENKTKEGVQVLESGVQYKVLQAGAGESPALTDRVSVRYEGRLLNGEVFDGTEGEETALFPVGGVIRGMSEMLQKMKVGEKVEVYIPAELAYGAEGPRDRTGRPRMDSAIGPYATLIFKLELIEIVK